MPPPSSGSAWRSRMAAASNAMRLRPSCLFRKAAEQGKAQAQFMLGVMLEQGRGVAQNLADAARWYRRAAEQEDVTAQLNLGACYELGRGVPQDQAQAVAWYRRAADQGEARAQANLGHAYANGRRRRAGLRPGRRLVSAGGRPGPRGLADSTWESYTRARCGVQRSDVEACRWFLIAESRAASPEDRAAYAAARERLTRRMTAAQLNEAQRLAREWIAAFNSSRAK